MPVPISEFLTLYISREQIKDRVIRLGHELTNDYYGKNPILVGVLKGAFIFLADLIRELDFPLEISFITLSSYKGEHSGTIRKVFNDSFVQFKDRHILIVEDIVDTGKTLHYLVELINKYSPLSVKICTLLDKPSKRIMPIKPDYVGFTIEDKWVTGYGLDLDGHYRNMPEIYTVSPQK